MPANNAVLRGLDTLVGAMADELTRAIEHHRGGRFAEAERAYAAHLERHPDDAAVWSNLGDVLRRLGRCDEAIAACRRAMKTDPSLAAARHNLALALLATGNALRRAGRVDEAIAAYRESVEISPTSADVWNNLGSALQACGKLDDASEAFERAIRLQPDLLHPHTNLGIVRREQGRLAEALAAHRRAVELAPNSEAVLSNYAATLRTVGRIDEAEDACRRAVASAPRSALAHNNLGQVLTDQGRVAGAVREHRVAVESDPASAAFHSNLLYAMQLEGTLPAPEMFAEHRRWDEIHARPLARRAEFASSRDPDRVLRIGYVSPDFGAHPVGRFILPAIEHHDRGAFHVTCYSTSAASDALMPRFRAAADVWRDVAGLSDEQLVHAVRDDAIDVLVDLSGHTGRHRLLVFARSPAPVQASYLGYPDTTGMAAMNWRITDAAADPVGMTEKWHSERLARVPTCAWCFEPPMEAVDASVDRVANGRVTFGSFNKLGKVSDATIDLWAKVLLATPGSRMILKSKGLASEVARRRVLELFAARGIEVSRLDLRTSVASLAEHFAMYREIDVALDTFPYCGTTTTCEALWMGVPVVTLAGERHVSRVGESLLDCAGLGETIASGEDDFVRITTAAVGRFDRREMRGRVRSSPVMDATQFARELEGAFRMMWRDYCGGAK